MTLGVQVKDVMEMEMRLTSRDPAFDAPAGEDDDSAVSKLRSTFLKTRAWIRLQLAENDDWEVDNNTRLIAAVKTSMIAVATFSSAAG